ncbi:MAG: hypothetical protein HY695_30495 [Deltaproteobacteria bacterium]|nr:hypothetical protein [Deltaproteobacteria bacterium]
MSDWFPNSWSSFLKKADRISGMVAHEFGGPNGKEKAAGVQLELLRLLQSLIEGKPDRDLYEALGLLVGLEKHIQLSPANKKAAQAAETDYTPLRMRPGRRFFKIHRTKWALESFPKVLDARGYLLSIMEAALTEGELSRLRQCRLDTCSKFFVAKDTKREFHDDSCKVTYFNKRHLAEKYHTKNRQRKRELAEAKNKK